MRKALTAISWLWALIGLQVGVAHGIAGHSSWSGTTVISISLLLVATAFGISLHRPSAIIIATLLGTAMPLGFSLATDESSLSTAQSELLVIVALAVLALGLVWFIKKRLGSRASGVFADGVIVAMGGWVLIWVVLVRPLLDSQTSSSVTTLRAVSLGAAMVVLFLLSTLLFSNTTPSASSSFFGIAVGLALVGVVLRAVSFRPDVSISASTFTVPFLMASGFAGAAFLHPSLRIIGEQSGLRLSPPLMTRLLTTTVSLIAPIIVLALTDAHNTQDRVVRTMSVAVLAVAATIRIIQSVRANATTQERLVRNALTDSLTGLPNRILMLEHIEQAVQMSWRTHKQPTVLFIDVDRFKNINDSLGHSIGDDVLMRVASRLLSCVKEDATVARISGDEFVVLDPTTESPTQSVMLAEAILEAFREPVPTPEGDMFVTASIGVAYAPRELDLSADQLLRHADTAMYRAKAAGRNCIALFDDSMLHSVSQRLDVETALYRALERNELHLVHQPIVDIDLGIVVGFEALMRWQRQDGEIVSPADFIPIAEETGTIVPLGSWAINDALQQLKQWIETGVVTPSTTMSVNVSPRQLHDPQFVTTVSDALQASGLPAEQLWLEVTESVMMTEPAQALLAFRRLNSLGVRIAIDDFGTGYSSLSLLQQFPIQCIKIDKSFVQNITEATETHNMVRTIIAMAQAMGADVVAEGIETLPQLSALQSLQCHRAQGYFISRPIDAANVPHSVVEIHNVDNWRHRFTT
ncbi:MAG: putative bifunctional diguanylate cyclase/phosphodiesterase [Ilumatobacteraceae bacterium]